MFNPHPYDSQQFEASRRALRRAYIEDGVSSEEVDFPCFLQAGDGLSVQRHGIPHGAASWVSVSATAGPCVATAALSALDARKLAATLLDMADEIDPQDPRDLDKVPSL